MLCPETRFLTTMLKAVADPLRQEPQRAHQTGISKPIMSQNQQREDVYPGFYEPDEHGWIQKTPLANSLIFPPDSIARGDVPLTHQEKEAHFFKKNLKELYNSIVNGLLGEPDSTADGLGSYYDEETEEEEDHEGKQEPFKNKNPVPSFLLSVGRAMAVEERAP